MNSEKKLVKVAIIGTNGVPANYGGFETLVEYLTKYLGNSLDLTVYCSKTPKNRRLKKYNNANLKYIPLSANNSQSIIYDIISIIHSWLFSDVLLILGVSGCIILPFKFFFKKRKIILNFGGLDWQRSKWNSFAKAFLKFSEKIAIKYSDIIISDNYEIAAYVKKTYNRDSIVIEYGGDQAFTVEKNTDNETTFDFLKSDYYLSVARIQPDNNLEMMLDAFVNLPDKVFVLISNWNHSIYGDEVKNKYKDYNNIILIGPIYDQNILNLVRSNCKLYIHGHSAGGTNPALVEAMYLQLPIAAYDVSFNISTTENKALYFNNSQQLVKLIQDTKDNVLLMVKEEMKEIATRRYMWEKIAKKYEEYLSKI